MSGRKSMEKKRIIFMRHGSTSENGSSYENMNYEEFMKHMLKGVDPKLNGSNSNGKGFRFFWTKLKCSMHLNKDRQLSNKQLRSVDIKALRS